ncbi:hypothetical protein Bbelb_282680 [Branchiostoma belcheri]|nr:hypothetical protein Bbelb_282680 [Branchiostoma belcheri]
MAEKDAGAVAWLPNPISTWVWHPGDGAAEMPRIASRQHPRANAQATTPQQYYRRNTVIPFLDHIITSLSDRFTASAKIATSLTGLVPSIVCSTDVRLQDDLTSPELFPMELNRWKNYFLSDPPELRPASPAEAVKRCDDTMFPNIGVLLKITCTLPVFFLDYGNVRTIDIASLRKMPAELFESIRDIKPSLSRSTEGRWDAVAAHRFFDMVNNKILSANVHSMVHGTLRLDLHWYSTNQEQCRHMGCCQHSRCLADNQVIVILPAGDASEDGGEPFYSYELVVRHPVKGEMPMLCATLVTTDHNVPDCTSFSDTKIFRHQRKVTPLLVMADRSLPITNDKHPANSSKLNQPPLSQRHSPRSLGFQEAGQLKLNIGEPALPRYHQVYLLKAEVTNRFDKNFLKPVVAMENVLLGAANSHDFSDALDKVMTSVGRTVTRPMFLLQSGGALGIARAKRFWATNSTNEPTEALFLAHEDTNLGQVHHVWSYCLVINNKAEYDHRASDCPKKKGVKDRPPRRQNARPSSTTSI